MTKHLAIKDEIYEELAKMKPDEDRSFSFVLRQLIDQNKKLEEENQILKKEIEFIRTLVKPTKETIATANYAKENMRLQSECVD